MRPEEADREASRAFAADAQGATAAAPVGRQDFLIPRAGNQLLRSHAVARHVPPRKEACVLYHWRRSLRQTCAQRQGRAS